MIVEVTEPGRLWALLALPLFVLLALPPRPGREVLTAHLPQWLLARARQRQRPVRWRWLRLLLALLACASALLAWSGLRLAGQPGPLRLVVLIDASASLGARGAPPAWEDLIRRLEKGLRALPAHVAAATSVVRCGTEVSSFALGDDPAPVDDPARTDDFAPRLGAPDPVAGTVDFDALAHQALATPDVAVWTLTDGQAGVPAVGALDVVSTAGDNVAITSLDIVDAWPLPEVTVHVRLENFGATAQRLSPRVGCEPGVLADPAAAHTLDLAARSGTDLEFQLVRGAGGRVEIRLREPVGPSDALAADDAVAFTLPAPAAPRIAVRSDGRVDAMRAAANALAGELGGEVVELDDAGARASFLLVEGGALARDAWEGVVGIAFGTHLLAAGEASPAAGAGSNTASHTVDWDRSDPRTAGLDFSELHADAVRTAVAGRVLVHGEAGPLVALRPDGRGVHFAFRLAQSNLGLLPAFPQFLRRCFAAAHGEAGRPQLAATNLLRSAESDLRPASVAPPSRPLPTFGAPPVELAVPLLLLALFAMALRIYV